ncbi:hypothetical protein H4S08_001056 [Coemansia sp. RSA 1365]|nr:hypothetical protein H4S08_001056 [Coemansia sp. RSA 1365]
MAVVGFIPLALVNVMYGSHIRCIRILGGINRRLLKKARKEEKSGKSQIEFPVENNTPLLIQKFSVFPLDPTIPLYVRDLEPGPSRKYSVQWMYKGRTKTEVFRISKKVIQFHPDVRALDMLIRKNAAMKSGANSKSNTENETKML